MKLIRNPELKGILALILVILAIGAGMAISAGKLEQWFGITWFSGPALLDSIVYVSDKSGDADIYAMKPDGSQSQRLTTKAGVLSAPAISATGRRIAFVAMKGKDGQIFSIGAAGGKPQQLTTATGPKREPSYSPDAKKLSFICSGKVYVSEPSGEGLAPVLPTEAEERVAMADPMRGESPTYCSYLHAREGEAMVGVTRDRANCDTIVFLPKPEGEPRIVPLAGLINSLLERGGETKCRIAAGQPVQVVGMSRASEADTFAASIVSGKNGYLMIFSAEDGQIKVSGFKPFAGHGIGAPSLSPDGSSLVAALDPAGGKSPAGLIRVDLSSGATQMIVSGDFDSPAYSPSGDHVLATKSDPKTHQRDVVLVDLSSGEIKQLTNDGHSYNPIWSPVSKQ